MMTDWHADVEISYQAGQDEAVETMGRLIEAAPGYALARHDAGAGRLMLGLVVQASTLRQAIDQAVRAHRATTAQVFGRPRPAEAIRVRPATWVEQPTREELVGAVEAGTILNVSRQRVHELAATHEGFPVPIARLASGPVWTRSSIEAFDARWERKRTGRPRKVAR